MEGVEPLEVAKRLRDRLLDVKDLAEELVRDVIVAVESIDPTRAHTHRAYVRSVFAMIEGVLSGMASYVLEGQAWAGWELAEREVRVLWDAVPDPSVERPDGGRSTLSERTKVTFKAGRRIFGDHCPTDFGGPAFAAFLKAIAARDRLMHPKRRADLDVRQEDVATVDKARDWFRFGTKAFFEAAATELQTRLRKGAGRRTTR